MESSLDIIDKRTSLNTKQLYEKLVGKDLTSQKRIKMGSSPLVKLATMYRKKYNPNKVTPPEVRRRQKETKQWQVNFQAWYIIAGLKVGHWW